MKLNINRIAMLGLGCALLFSCSKTKKDIQVPYPADITFEDIKSDWSTFKIPDANFSSGDAKTGRVTMNVKKNSDGSFSGFAISNKNWRSYPWSLSSFGPVGLAQDKIKASIDSTAFSVFTTRPNRTGNFLVASVKDDDANITLDKPSVVEHILVANTTYNYLLESYGSIYSGTLDAKTQSYLFTGTPIKNIMNPNQAPAMFGQFKLPGLNGENLIRLAGTEILAKAAAGKAAADAARLDGKDAATATADSTKAAAAIAKGYVKLTINGFKGGTATGNVDYYLAIRPNVDQQLPQLSYIAPDWFKVDLSSLGTVDKLVFHLSSSYVDGNGKMLYPPYFCLDGIRVKK